MASSTACFLHSYVPSTSTNTSHRLSPVVVRPPATLSCRAHKQQQQEEATYVVEDAAISRRLALTVLVGGAAVGAKVSPADAAYGEAANVFGKAKTNTDFMEYAGDGFKVLVPAKWSTSKEVEFPGQVMRYEDNFDSLSNISVSVVDCNKKSIADYGTPAEFIGQFDYLLGKQSYSGKTEAEGGFDRFAVASANVLEISMPVLGGTQYYNITVLTRTADGTEGGRHQIIIAAVKGSKLYICKAQAGDKRWFKGARKFVESSANSFNVA